MPLNHKLSSLYYCNRTRPPNRLHAIMIDTEPKVTRHVATQSPKWLDPANLKTFEHGRGNNWSYGYLHHLPLKQMHSENLAKGRKFSHIEPNNLEKKIQENMEIPGVVVVRVRKELEMVDCEMGVNLVGNLGGAQAPDWAPNLQNALKRNSTSVFIATLLKMKPSNPSISHF